MEKQEIIHRVNETLHSGFEIPLEDLKPEADLFADLKLDSLDAVDMLVYIEEKLAIRVDSDSFKEVRTLNDVYRMVENLVPSRQVNN